MTKADQANAVVALALAAVFALIGHHLRGNSALFTFGFPAVMWVVWFWMNRALTARALAKRTDSEVIFERPIVLRSLFCFFAVLLAALLTAIIPVIMDDTAFYQKLTGVEYSTGEYILMLLLPVISVGLPCLLFLWMAGPYRVLFDLNHCRYSLTQGLPLITRTIWGVTDGGALYVHKVRSARHQIKFRPSGHNWGYLLDTYETDQQARTQAQQLADELGLNVERRDGN